MEIKFRFRLKLIIDNWGTYKKGDVDTFFISLLDEKSGLVRFGIDKQWEVISCDTFTGKEDSQIDGNEVYENDIIENCDTKLLQVVYWNENEASWYCRYVGDESRIVSLSDSLGNLNTVVGNIFDNPNLLQ
jgi:hypothetical protein